MTKSKGIKRPWTEAEDARLRELAAAGTSLWDMERQIGTNRNRNAIRARCRRQGIYWGRSKPGPKRGHHRRKREAAAAAKAAAE